MSPFFLCFSLNPFPLSSHLLADLLVALRGDEHLDAGLVHIVDVGPVSLDLWVLDAAGQAVDGPRRPGDRKNDILREASLGITSSTLPSQNQILLMILTVFS